MSKDKKIWKRSANACIKDAEKIENLSVLKEITEISGSHQLELYPAALLYHSQKERS